jgi:hypothetical protein
MSNVWTTYNPAGTLALPKTSLCNGPTLYMEIQGDVPTDGNGASIYAGPPPCAFPDLIGIASGVNSPAKAGLRSGPGSLAAADARLRDSLGINVVRGAGQVTISINGFARHYNPAAAPNGGVSKISVTVYPDSNSAKAGTGAVPNGTGEMRFFGTSKMIVTGFFNPGDFTAPTAVGDSTQIATVPGLQKVVNVPNSARACIRIHVDPDAENGVLPAASPPGMALLASLLVGAGLFVVARGRLGTTRA